MKINVTNINTVNFDITYIHDYIFKEMKFDYTKKNIYIIISKNNDTKTDRIIKFNNVIGFNMISCDFWGQSPHILDWEFTDKDNTIINKLFDEKNNHDYQDSRLTSIEDYIESIITFTSGNRLTIACEDIIVD